MILHSKNNFLLTSDLNFTSTDGSTVYYNFCRNNNKKCNGDSSLMIAEKQNQCAKLAGDADILNEWSLLSNLVNNIDQDNPDSGIRIQLSKGQICQLDQSLNYTITYELTCDPKLERGIIVWSNMNEFNANNCFNVLKGSTYEGNINFF